jgi:hypothetical protein
MKIMFIECYIICKKGSCHSLYICIYLYFQKRNNGRINQPTNKKNLLLGREGIRWRRQSWKLEVSERALSCGVGFGRM